MNPSTAYPHLCVKRLCLLVSLAFSWQQAAHANCSPSSPLSGQTIVCTGTNATGVYAPSASDVVVEVSAGTNITSVGIQLGANAQITNDGQVGAFGIGVAPGPNVGASIVNNGTISITSPSTIAANLAGQGSMTNSGSIVTSGALDSGIYSNSGGIFAANSMGTIRNSGSIQLNGVGGYGILVAGNQAVINSGSISTLGDTSYAIGLNTTLASDHPSFTNLASGSVRSSGNQSPAVLATTTTNSSTPVSVTNSGVISASGSGSDAVSLAVLASGGQIAIANSGTITATGSGADALRINGLTFFASPPDSNVVVNNNAGGVIQSAQANAIESLAGSTQLTNKGTIMGNVVLAPFAQNTVTLVGGSRIVGDLDLGEDAGSTLTLSGSADAPFSGAVSGNIQAPEIVKNGTSQWILDEPVLNNHSVVVTEGMLALDVALPGSAVRVQANGQLSGFGTIADLENLGTVSPGSATALNRNLTVLGNYTGTGRLVFNTSLQGSAGLVDRLIVAGSTNAKAQVSLNNVGGAGGLTTGNGIELIEVEGGANAASFQMQPRQIGQYVYTLVEAGPSANSPDTIWYLRSVAGRISLSPAGDPVVTPYVTPEGSAVLAYEDFGRTAFGMTLYDRLGSQRSTLPDLAGGDSAGNAWGRLSFNNLSWERAASGSTTDASHSLAQFGTDLWATEFSTGDGLRLGATATYADSYGTAATPYDSHTARFGANGLAAGLYATWFEDSHLERGFYVDGWALLGGLNDHVTTTASHLESSESESQGSIELGYTVALGEAEVLVTPQLQLVASDLYKRSLKDSSGAPLSEGGSSLTARFGVRISGTTTSAGAEYCPYLEANAWHDDRAVAIIDNGVAFESGLPRQRFEIQGGIEWRLARSVTLLTGVSLQKGEAAYQSTSAHIALKVEL